MKNYLSSLLIAIVCLGVPVVTEAQDFTPQIGWDKQLFPSFVISSSTLKSPPWIDEDREDILGDKGGLLGVLVTSPSEEETSITVTISCDEIMEDSTFTGTLEKSETDYLVMPQIKYRYTKLAEINQATPVSMTFQVQIGDDDPTEQTATVTIRSINDCPFMVGLDENRIDISHTFAAYVNEQHPFIDKLLREALDDVVVNSFSGYQGDEAEVIRQVYALWDLLVMRDVRYSSITATSVKAETVWCQHVRLIEESLNNSQANCVDGSVLFASMLRKIGIEPFLVLVPGHCYVGFYLDAKQERMMALETTLLGSAPNEDGEYSHIDLLEEAVPEEKRGEASWQSFCNAVAIGASNFAEAQEKIAAGESDKYLVIEIEAARKVGIMPIAFHGKEDFVALDREAISDEEMTDEDSSSEEEDSADEETSEEEEE